MIKGILKGIFRILGFGFRIHDYRGVYKRRSAVTKILVTGFFTLLALACIAGEVIFCEILFNGAFEGKRLLILIIGIPVAFLIGMHSFEFFTKCSLAAFNNARRIRKENRRIEESASVVERPLEEGEETIEGEVPAEQVSGEYISKEDNEKKSPVLDTLIGVFTLFMGIALVAAVIIIPIAYLKVAGNK